MSSIGYIDYCEANGSAKSSYNCLAPIRLVGTDRIVEGFGVFGVCWYMSYNALITLPHRWMVPRDILREKLYEADDKV